MKNKAIIVAKNLTKKFTDNTGVKGLNFHIKSGEILGFLGPSGSGKTTTINLLTGQLESDEGVARVLGIAAKDLTTNEYEELGIVSDDVGYYEKLTLYENIELYAKLHNVSLDKIDTLLDKVGLLSAKNKLAEKLSTGMKQRMLLVRSIINQPRLLFLDEPTSGLDPHTARKIHALMDKLRQKGTTIFLTTHDMDEATNLCDHVILLNQGRIIEEGTPQSLIKKYQKNKEVQVENMDGSQNVISFNQIQDYLEENEVFTIHSTEPTLEDVFIELTGVKLND